MQSHAAAAMLLYESLPSVLEADIRPDIPRQQVFKRWAAAVMRQYPHLDVSTCHNYEIAFAFRWQCTNPGCAYGTQSTLHTLFVAVIAAQDIPGPNQAKPKPSIVP